MASMAAAAAGVTGRPSASGTCCRLKSIAKAVSVLSASGSGTRRPTPSAVQNLPDARSHGFAQCLMCLRSEVNTIQGVGRRDGGGVQVVATVQFGDLVVFIGKP